MGTGILRVGASAAGAIVVFTLATCPQAHGLTFDVNNTADAADALIDGTCATTAVPPVCTLRAAIQEANATIESDVINLPDGKYVLKLVGAGEDNAATGGLDILHDLTINGAGAKAIIRGKKDRVFQIATETPVTMRDLTISKGKLGKKGDSGSEFSGGGIRNEGDLTLERVVVANNTAAHGGGGISSSGGSLTLTDVTVRNNKSLDDDGGGFDLGESTVTLTRVTISKNKSADEGGGIEATDDSVVTMTNCTVSGNSAKAQGGGLRNENGAALALTNVTIAGNKGGRAVGSIPRRPRGLQPSRT
ncbi:MAG: right-handed parallel beta-helix repeat-containing protein [Deltaproteobacteria bacterium]|nr:right-handed parallel beta-helix repeat-containing protein [Deltaproteobacteria bacterium]